eukprot:jgi/Bigna1/70323/fgenesh1_pg.11_\
MSATKVKSTTVDFDPLRNPDMFKFGGNPEKKKVAKKVAFAKKKPEKATPNKATAGEGKKKPPAPKPQPVPEAEEEEEEEDIFGAAEANEGEGSIPKSFLDGAPVATSSSEKDPFAEGKTEESGGLQDVYIPKEAMEKRSNELKAEALDEDLVNMGDDADLAKFDSQNEDRKKLVIEPLPDTVTTKDEAADPQNDAIDDDLFNMVDGGAGGGGGGEEGGLDISKYIAQNDKGASDDLFS